MPMTPLQALAGSAFSRVADARQADGNAVRLLCDGTENFPLWLVAIADARRTVHLENYILEDDSTGRAFADALMAAARRGVACRVVYDWLGCRVHTPPAFWNALRAAGIEVRCYNPPRFGSPLVWISRDHRKLLCVDGQVAFTGGLCIGHDWAGDLLRDIPPWRDTAVEIRGPGVAHLEDAFADSWAACGAPMPMSQEKPIIKAAGDIGLWVIAGSPNSMGLYRLEQLVAEIVERSLWLADAYFVATTGYVRALTGAARAGVDVRLLVPGANNWPVVQALSRAGYRPLLEAGVRVFEWNGPMMHAKTAVADGIWSRIGSSNSNLASWISNRELDITIEDAGFARLMEAQYARDLENATEIVLESGRTRRLSKAPQPRGAIFKKGEGRAHVGRLLAGAVGFGSALSANLAQHRALGPSESRVPVAGGAILLVLAAGIFVAPRLIAYPLGALAAWIGVTLLLSAYKRFVHKNGR